MNKKFNIITLGCKTNQYESEAFSKQFKDMGFEKVKKNGIADLYLINTCAVTNKASISSKKIIKKILKDNPNSKIYVTGCILEYEKDEILSYSDNIEIIKNEEKEDFFKDKSKFIINEFEGHTRAFVKIQDGCDNFCSYCIVPFTRKRSRSRDAFCIIEEIRALVQNGYKEIVLTGIDIGDYKFNDYDLSSLIEDINKIEGLNKIRISSIDPDDITDNLINALKYSDKIARHMHLSLQSGSDEILKKMRRKYTIDGFYKAVDRLKGISDGFAISTDIIVGFPYETDKEFNETKKVVENVQFSKVHVFPYSSRPNTLAATWKDNFVKKEVILKRKKEIEEIAVNEAFKFRQKFIKNKMKVLLENNYDLSGKYIYGHADNFLLVKVLNEGFTSNNELLVNIEANTQECLVGKKCLN